MVVIASGCSTSALLNSKLWDFIPTICVTDRLSTYRRLAPFWRGTRLMCPTPIEETRLQRFINEWLANTPT